MIVGTRFLSFVLALAAPAALSQTKSEDCPMHPGHAGDGPPPAASPQAHTHDSSHQHDHAMSPYAGREGSEVKALTAEELQAYRDGMGLGMAKPAELNHYPGPRHVLDLAGELKLIAAQSDKLKAVFGRMHEKAVRLGAQIIEKEKALDQEFASGSIDETKLRELTAQIAAMQAELRATHLAAHLETKRILTERQVSLYDELRGYAKPAGS